MSYISLGLCSEVSAESAKASKIIRRELSVVKQKEIRKAINTAISDAYGMDFIELTRRLPDKILLEVGKIIARTDYAVRFFKNKGHPKFYHNREALERAVRRGWHLSFFYSGERVADYLVRNEYEINRLLQKNLSSRNI